MKTKILQLRYDCFIVNMMHVLCEFIVHRVREKNAPPP